MVLSGLRGVGKTVLLGAFEDRALHNGWVTVTAEITITNISDSWFVEGGGPNKGYVPFSYDDDPPGTTFTVRYRAAALSSQRIRVPWGTCGPRRRPSGSVTSRT